MVKDMRITTHVKTISKRAHLMINALIKITSKKKSPNSIKKQFLAATVLSTVLYASQIWNNAAKYKKYKTILDRVNRRLSIMCTSAYRTEPTEAVQVTAGLPPSAS